MIMTVVPHNNAYLRLGIEFYFLQSGTYHMNFSHEYILAICFSLFMW